jgi:hypothetical protein
MPLAAAMPVLSAELKPLFMSAPLSATEAGVRFAGAYATYCLAGGVAVVPPRQEALAQALSSAFDADGGHGASGLVGALAAFWPGTSVPAMAPSAQVVAFTPMGDLSLIVPGAAEMAVAAQAEGLAGILHALTMASVKVVIPPSPTVMPIV